MWVSHKYTYVLFFLNFPPTRHPNPPLFIVTEHQVELLVLYSNFPLASYFTHGYVYVSMPVSHLSHLLLPPLCPQVCSLHLHLCSCPTNRFICNSYLYAILHLKLLNVGGTVNCSTSALPNISFSLVVSEKMQAYFGRWAHFNYTEELGWWQYWTVFVKLT